jgi:hypothetical protein
MDSINDKSRTKSSMSATLTRGDGSQMHIEQKPDDGLFKRILNRGRLLLMELIAHLDSARVIGSKIMMVGVVTATVFGPDGVIKQQVTTHNLVSDVGDIYSAKKVTGTAVTGMAGMKLGTANTAASKNGAGSFIATGDYVSGSAQAFDATYPKLGSSNNIAQFQVTYAAGTATNATINRVSICDNTTNAGEADATHTFSTAVFGSTINKGASDTLAVTWNVTYLGA